MKTLIIIPAYNEAGNIKNVVDDLAANCPQYEYIIINDSSKDGTESVCKQNNYNYISLPINLGIGGGVQTGYKYALGMILQSSMTATGSMTRRILKK